MTNPLGIYIHIPFCKKRCAYCDFYSSFESESLKEEYLSALSKEIKRWGGLTDRPIDTVYIGGGTPSVIGSKIEDVLNCVKENFNVQGDAEITVEANPETDEVFLKSAYNSGANRLSLGVQSANESELKLLGRIHTANKVTETVNKARDIGFKNISLDLMLGLPYSNLSLLNNSVEFLCSLSPEHISAYILKVEQNTLFAKQNVPILDDDTVGEQYLFVCDKLRKKGYNHYEISNFAKIGFESKHNLRYWKLKDYLGIGPAAHSCLDDKRFFYEKDLKQFILNPQIKYDDLRDEKTEKLMLKLRLASGIDLSEFFKEDSYAFTFAKKLCNENLAKLSGKYFSLTDKGMLISNSVITEFLEML